MSTLEGFITDVQAAIGTEWVHTEALAPYAVDGIVPAVVAMPADDTQVAAVLRLANTHAMTIVPRGGGTYMHLGQVPTGVDVILSLERVCQIIAYEPGDMTITVQAGMALQDIQHTLGQNGQFLALDPPLTAATTLGGVIAANASGPRRFLYGTARDLVLGTVVIGVDGTRTKAGGRVVKNVTGYDLNKLYIGSLGTLAVLTELTCKVYPLPPREETIGIGYRHAADTLTLLQMLTQLPLRLNSLELLNASAMALVTRHAAVENPATPYVLLARLEGTPETTASQCQRLRDALRSLRLTSAATMYTWEQEERLWAGVAAWLQQPVGVLSKVSARMSDLPQLCAAAQATEPAWSLLAHAGNGITYLHFPPAADPTLSPAHWLAQITALDTLVATLRGHRVIERAPVAVKQQCQVWGEPGDQWPLMQALKTTFDPQRRLNPGRFLGGL